MRYLGGNPQVGTQTNKVCAFEAGERDYNTFLDWPVHTPLTTLLKKEQRKTSRCNSEASWTFHNLQTALVHPPALHTVQPGYPFIQFMDTSDVGLGALLTQHAPPFRVTGPCNI